MPAHDAEHDAIEEAAAQARDKERAVYWVCRLLEVCHDPELEQRARAALAELGYSPARIVQMVALGEPAAHRES